MPNSAAQVQSCSCYWTGSNNNGHLSAWHILLRQSCKQDTTRIQYKRAWQARKTQFKHARLPVYVQLPTVARVAVSHCCNGSRRTMPEQIASVYCTQLTANSYCLVALCPSESLLSPSCNL
jgi:hypothetical protein